MINFQTRYSHQRVRSLGNLTELMGGQGQSDPGVGPDFDPNDPNQMGTLQRSHTITERPISMYATGQEARDIAQKVSLIMSHWYHKVYQCTSRNDSMLCYVIISARNLLFAAYLHDSTPALPAYVSTFSLC